MADKQNLYQKIQKVRAELVDAKLKKAGKNKHTQVSYFELGDLLPTLNKLLDKHGLMTQFNLVEDLAMLHIYDTDTEKSITFSCPTAEVKLVGGQPIQNLGGQITYLRRYLHMVAFEISEGDLVDASNTASELSLADEDISLISSAQTLDELTKFCAAMKQTKGPKFTKLILDQYNARKAELEAE